MPKNNNATSRHRERARAFQVIYGLFFANIDSAKTLARVFQRTMYAEPEQGAEFSLELDWSDEEEGAAGRGVPLPRNMGDTEDVTTPDLAAMKEAPQGFAWELVLGVWHKQTELDELIRRFSQNWRLERMGRVELAMLRMAVYELVFRDDVPPKVILNEAVELSKQFGDDNSRSFINGILDSVSRAVESKEIKRASSFWGK